MKFRDSIHQGLQKAIAVKNAPVFLSVETCRYGSPNKAVVKKRTALLWGQKKT